MRSLLRVALLSAAFLLGTFVAGWWGVLVIALAWGVIGRHTPRPALTAAGAACLAWGLLLLWTAAMGPMSTLTRILGALPGIPGWIFVLMTLLVPALLAWLAARVAR